MADDFCTTQCILSIVHVMCGYHMIPYHWTQEALNDIKGHEDGLSKYFAGSYPTGRASSYHMAGKYGENLIKSAWYR